jgi:hypothetical protein
MHYGWVDLAQLQRYGACQPDGIFNPSRFTGQPGHSSAVTQDDGQKTLCPDHAKALIELGHIDFGECVSHTLLSCASLSVVF